MSASVLVGQLDQHVITSAVIKVAAAVLDRTVDAVKDDRRAWEVTEASEVFNGSYLPHVDWATMTLTLPLEPLHSDSRTDFDLGRSFVWATNLLERGDVDSELKAFLEPNPILYGTQIQALIQEGRIDSRWLSQFEGCVRTRTDSLVDSMKALLMLDDPNATLSVPDDVAELDPTYAELIASLGPAPLQRHVGLFFQTAYAARSEGLLFQSRARSEATQRHLAESLGMPYTPRPHDPDCATWLDGEGLRSVTLSLRDESAIGLVPPRRP